MSVSKEVFLDMIGHFTWSFGCEFFIETPNGNYIWSDPDYYGDNTVTPYDGTIQEYFGNSFGRDKGKHQIGKY